MDAIIENQQFAALHGWAPELWGATAVDAQLVENIRVWQAARGLPADGVCGPDTYKARLDADFEARRPELADEDAEVRLRVAGELAVNRATRMWLDDIRDPPDDSAAYERSRRAIDRMIRSEAGLRWSGPAPYVKNNDFAWCGAFLASAWAPVGLAPALRKHYCPSTYRLDRAGRYLPAPDEKAPIPPANPTERRKYLNLVTDGAGLDAFGPRAGDVLLVNGEGYGEHIALVESFDPARGVFRTLEGNGVGASPTGKRIEGVVRHEQPLSAARRLLRWSLHDLEP